MATADATTQSDPCSLSDAERGARGEAIRREIVPLVVRREELANGLAFEFEHSPEMERKLSDFVEFERSCCSGLRFELRRFSDSRTLRLSIEGDGARIFEGIGASAPREAGGVARLAKAGGLGLVLSFFVFCVLPIGAVAVLGASAAPLAGLDDPWVIAGGSVAAAVPAWLLLRRRAARAGGPAPGDCSGC